ncbi:MAG: succinate dehydrogenase cytochrome b subunit [Acidobacteriota bacterium]
MGSIVKFFRSTVFLKAVMAITGFLLFGFIVGHLTGNLKLYQGPEAINSYAEGLRELGKPFLAPGQFLWIARFGLLAAVGLHIWSAWRLTLINHRARPQRYVAGVDWQKSTYASRTMRWSGVIIATYVIYHLLHFTTGHAHGDFVYGDVYHNVVSAFQQPLVSAIYIVANLLLAVHLYHGLWSMFQSIGWTGPRFDPFRQRFAIAFAVIIALGNLSFPLAVLSGIVR